jgi:hypothetical protein
VHGLRDPCAVGGQRRRSEGQRDQQEHARVLEAGLAAIRRSWEAQWGHPGTVAAIASRDNRAFVTNLRRLCVSGGGTSDPR